MLLNALTLCIAPASAQTNLYVDGVGDCAGNTSCYATIGSAVAAAGPGTAIYVFPGTYAESVDLASMAIPGDIAIVAVDASSNPTAGTVTVDPGAIGGPGAGSAFHSSVAPFSGKVTIDGFIVASPDADGIVLTVDGDVLIANVTAIAVGDGEDVDDSGDDGVDVRTQSGDITVTQCTANGNFGTFGDGFDLQSSAGSVAIISCTANNNRGVDDNQGFEVERVGGNLTISDTVANGNSCDGFLLSGVQGAVSISDSAAEDNGCAGFYVGGVSQTVTISVSTAIGNGDTGFDVTEVERDVTFTGSTANENAWLGFWADARGGITISACAAENNGDDGFGVNCGDGLTIQDCRASKNGYDGYWVEYAGGSVHITRSAAEENSGDGFYVDTDGAVTLGDCTASGNDRADEWSNGFSIFARGPLTATSCTANTNNDAGFNLGTEGQLTIARSIAQGNGYEGIWIEYLGTGPHQVSGSILCQNGVHGLVLQADVALDASGNWWGDASGPEHPGNPGGSGDAVRDSANGGSGTVARTPWIDSTEVSPSVDPVIAGEPILIVFRFLGGGDTVFLGRGPGDPHGTPPFMLATDNGSLTDSDETAATVHEFINQADGTLSIMLRPDTAGMATVTLEGPCNLDASVTVQVQARPTATPSSTPTRTPLPTATPTAHLYLPLTVKR